jgi:hypothetical protein
MNDQPPNRVTTAFLLIIWVIFGFVGDAVTQQQAPPAYFVFKGTHTGNDGDHSYNLTTGGSSGFRDNQETIFGKFKDASLSINLRVVNDQVGLEGDTGGLYIYVLGSPDTPFRLVYQYTEYVEAVNHSDGAYENSASQIGFQVVSVYSTPGQSHRDSVGGEGVETGTTTNQTISYLGQTYSLAWAPGRTISVGANTCCGTYNGHTEAKLGIAVDACSNTPGSIVLTVDNPAPPPSIISDPFYQLPTTINVTASAMGTSGRRDNSFLGGTRRPSVIGGTRPYEH